MQAFEHGLHERQTVVATAGSTSADGSVRCSVHRFSIKDGAYVMVADGAAAALVGGKDGSHGTAAVHPLSPTSAAAAAARAQHSGHAGTHTRPRVPARRARPTVLRVTTAGAEVLIEQPVTAAMTPRFFVPAVAGGTGAAASPPYTVSFVGAAAGNVTTWAITVPDAAQSVAFADTLRAALLPPDDKNTQVRF